MRRTVALWLALATGLACIAGGAATATRQEARPDSLLPVPFAPGERMEYDVKFGMFRVGRASMEMTSIDTVRGEPVYHVVFAVRGSAIFYSLSDTLQSWFSVRDLTSRRFIQDTEENGSARLNQYEIHPDLG